MVAPPAAAAGVTEGPALALASALAALLTTVLLDEAALAPCLHARSRCKSQIIVKLVGASHEQFINRVFQCAEH